MKHLAPKLVSISMVLLLVLLLGTGLQAQDSDPILVGHLTYHTGPFTDVGPWFDGVTNFTLDVINENPPLGREMRVIHEDIGTIGEARAARKLVEFEGVEVLLNPAHGYGYYRDWMVDYVTTNDRPIMPSVHGGAIDRAIGGIPTEPLFRGSPMDSAQAVAAVIQVQQAGAASIVIVATDIEGHQLQKNAAVQAAERSGLTILEVIEVQSELPSYQREIGQIQSLNPDAVVVFMTAVDGGIFVKNAADASMVTTLIGTTEWQGEEFIATATMAAIEQQDAVWVVAFAHADSPAWDYYEPLWSQSAYANLATAGNSYNLQYYDLLVVTALAIEAAGTTDASVWTEYVPMVAEGPGETVYTYAAGIEALRSGEDIDYSGVSGEMNYTDTGVVSGLFGIFEWVNANELALVNVLDDRQVLDLDA
jgi:ABC-type branched-subunit amino acid transport system substrate-binding protein